MRNKKKKYKKNNLRNLLEEEKKVEEDFGNKNKFKFSKKNEKRKKFKNKVFCKVPFFVKALIGLALFVGLFASAALYFFSGLKTDKNFDKSMEGLGLQKEEKINDRIINIAIFGLDKRKGEDTGRSDSIMVVSLDGVHKLIKVVSILRDTRLLIDGYGFDKLGHAFSYGGANLAVKTLNKNFKLDIEDYVSLNFSQMIHIVDAFGGVDTVIKRDQVDQINGVINSTPEYKNSARLAKFKEPEKFVHLNGAQALSYARIRKKDDEHHRATRQQIILNLLIQKLGRMNGKEYPGLLERLLPFTETSLTISDIFLKFFPLLLSIKSNASGNGAGNTIPIVKDIIPHDPDEDPDVKAGSIKGVWYWRYDIDKYAEKLHNFIYGEDEKSNLDSNSYISTPSTR